jgi:hypothetical protein
MNPAYKPTASTTIFNDSRGAYYEDNGNKIYEFIANPDYKLNLTSLVSAVENASKSKTPLSTLEASYIAALENQGFSNTTASAIANDVLYGRRFGDVGATTPFKKRIMNALKIA